jgi:L-rhamnose mutarotase
VHPIAHMADIMATKADSEPVSVPLVTVFHME